MQDLDRAREWFRTEEFAQATEKAGGNGTHLLQRGSTHSVIISWLVWMHVMRSGPSPEAVNP